MHHAEKTVTVYRKGWDEENAVDVYRGTVLNGVSFFSRISTEVSKEGLAHTCEAVLRIPIGTYNPSPLPLLGNGDLVCEGALPTEGLRPADLDELCPYVYTVIGVTWNTSGMGQHIKVVCK